MANYSSDRFFLFFIGLISLLSPCCKNDTPVEKDPQVPVNTPEVGTQHIPTHPIKNGVVIFVDNTSSLEKVDTNEALKGAEWIFQKTEPLIESGGGKVTIYFIQKSLSSASPFYEAELGLPDTKDMHAFKKKVAAEKFQKKVDSLHNAIKNAIKTPIKRGPGEETDIFVSLKKAKDRFSVNIPSDGKKLILYYSDMIESVKDSKCGKNYQKTYFKDVPEAIAAGKRDAAPIKSCYALDKLPENTSVALYIPIGALEESRHRYIPDYWKALFEEFGVKEVVAN